MKFPTVFSAESITFQHNINLKDPPPTLTMEYTECGCGGTFLVGPKLTKELIVRVVKCEFPKIVGPAEDGTILEIDEVSKAFTDSNNGISGFSVVRVI